jgi:hypothetical protein
MPNPPVQKGPREPTADDARRKPDAPTSAGSGRQAMRLIFFLVVFANLLFFAWTQGYFGSADDSREPQRLTQQLNADKLRIVRDAPAPVAKPADLACRVVNGLGVAEAETLKAAFAAVGGEAQISPLAAPPIHLVVITDLPNKAAVDKKAAELTRFGIKDQTAVEFEDGSHEIVLGEFPAEAAAREFLQGLVKRGIKSARVDSREPEAENARVELRASPSKLLPLLPQLIAPYAAATIGECAPQ